MNIVKKVWVIVYRLDEGAVKILALRPNPEPDINSDYYVITGGIEKGESSKQAAIRETEEEIGVTPLSILRLDKTLHYADKLTGKKYSEYCFAVQIDQSPLTLNEEHVDYKWLSVKNFVKTIWWIGSRDKLMDILVELMALISDNT